MRRQNPLTVCAAVLIASPLLAEKPSDAPTSGKIDRLIGQLHSAHFRQREAASAELEAMGEPALDPLKRAAADSDPEVANRAAALVMRIAARLETARRLKPTLVELRLENVSVEAAVAELVRQSGYAVKLTGGPADHPDRRVSLETGPVPFWEALGKLCDAADLHEVQSANQDQPHAAAEVPFRGGVRVSGGTSSIGRTIELARGRVPAAPSHVSGALRVRVVNGPEAAVLAPGEDEMSVVLRVDAEPRLAVEGVFAVRVDRAVDARGRPVAALPPPEPAALSVEEVMLMRRAAALRARGVLYRPAQVPAYPPGVTAVRFQKVETKPAELREWAGAAGVTLRTGEEELIALEKPLEARAGSAVRSKDVRLSIQQVTKRDDGNSELTVEVRHAWDVRPGSRGAVEVPVGRGVRFGQVVIQEASPAAEDARPFYGLALLDAQGRAVPTTGLRRVQMRVDGDGRFISYSLAVRPAEGERNMPVRLVFRGSRTVSVEVPFALTGVRLKAPLAGR